MFFCLNLKGTPSQEEHETIFSDFKICKMALPNQIDFLEMADSGKSTLNVSQSIADS
jgi:hypothetical protein